MDLPDAEYRPLFGGMPDRPLFGDLNRRDRILNVIVGAFVAFFVLVTFISAFANWPPKFANIYCVICLTMICASHCVLLYWYRQGDLDPKFRTLIYFNAFIITNLCVCANVYFYTK